MKTSVKSSFVEKIVEFAKTINVEPVIFLLCFGGGILELPARDLVLSKTCLAGSYFFGATTYSKDICTNLTNYPEEQSMVQHTVSKFNSVSVIMKTMMIMLVTVFLGSWCDSGGRKGLIVLTCLGRLAIAGSLLLNFMCDNLVIEFFWLDFPAMLSGYENSLWIGAYAIITDETSQSNRTIRILILSALWHIGMALANLVTGYILEYGTFYAVLGTYTATLIAALLYTVFLLRSSQTSNKNISCGNIFSFKGILGSVSTVFKKRENGVRHIIILLIFTSCLCEFTWGTRFVGIDYYYIRRKFSWPEVAENPSFPVTWLSQFYTIVDVPQTLAVFIIVPFLTNVFHVHDAVISTLGHLCLMVGVINIALATNRNMLYLNAALGIFIPTQTPSMRAMLSKIVESGEVGKVSTSLS